MIPTAKIFKCTCKLLDIISHNKYNLDIDRYMPDEILECK